MGIMSQTTLCIFGGLTLVAFIGLIVKWDSLTGSSVKKISIRTSSLLLVNFLFIFTLGLALNNYGGFYGSWSELVGIQQVVASVPENSIVPITKAEIAAGTITPDGGVILREVIKGEKSGIAGTILTVLPSSYVNLVQSNADPKSFRIFHVMQLLSGFPGYPSTWIHGMNMVKYFEHQQLIGAMPPTIAVLPQINVLPHRDTECLNVPNGPQIETWLSQDVIDFEKKHLNLRDERWGVAGYSTGGWCSAMLTLKDPKVFLAGASIAGYFEPQFATPFPKASMAEMAAAYNIKAIAASNPPAVNLLLVNSLRDASTNKETQNFYSLLQKPVKKSEITLVNSGHNLKAWNKIEPELFQWFGKVFKEERISTSKKLSA